MPRPTSVFVPKMAATELCTVPYSKLSTAIRFFCWASEAGTSSKPKIQISQRLRSMAYILLILHLVLCGGGTIAELWRQRDEQPGSGSSTRIVPGEYCHSNEQRQRTFAGKRALKQRKERQSRYSAPGVRAAISHESSSTGMPLPHLILCSLIYLR